MFCLTRFKLQRRHSCHTQRVLVYNGGHSKWDKKIQNGVHAVFK